MKKIISTIVVVMMVGIFMSCGTPEKEGLGNIPDYLQVRLKIADEKPVSMGDDIQFYWKDRAIEEIGSTNIRMSFNKKLKGMAGKPYETAKILLDEKKDEWMLEADYDRYIYGFVKDSAILLIPERSDKNDARIYMRDGKAKAKVVVCKSTIEGTLVWRMLQYCVYHYPLSVYSHDNLDLNSTKSMRRLPIRICDIDNDGIPELACYGSIEKYSTKLTWSYHEIDSRITRFNFSITPPEPIFDKASNTYNLVYKKTHKWNDDEFIIPHILKLEDEQLIDISYKYPATIQKIIEDDPMIDFEHPVVKYLYCQVVGTEARYIEDFLTEFDPAYEVKHWIDEGNQLEDIRNYLTQIHADNIVDSSKKKTTYQPEYENIELQETVENMDSDEDILNEIYLYQSREEAWEQFEKLYSKKDFISLEDVESIWFDETNDHDVKPDNLSIEQVNFNIEDNSYWPDRKLGKFKKIEIEDEMLYFDLNNETNFPLLMYRYIQTTHNYMHPFRNEICLDIEIGNWKPFKFYMIPFSKDIWIIYNNYRGDRTSSQYSIVEFNDKRMRQILDWRVGFMHNEFVKFMGICDVNVDYIPDLVMYYEGLVATNNSSNYVIYSIIDDRLVQLDFGIEGLGQVEFFYGMDDGYPHFGTFELGINAFDFKLYTCEASMRYSCIHVLEPREDGCIYDVTYLYPTEEHIGVLKSVKEANRIGFYALTHLESLGLTRAGQKKFLEVTEGETLSENDKISNNIIRDCMKIDKPFHVQSTEDIPEGWEINHVYR